MNNLPSIPPRDPGFHLGAPMDTSGAATPPPRFRPKKFLYFLRRFWWIPLITVVLALGIAIAVFISSPPEFVSTAYLVQTEKLELPGGGASFSEDADTYFGTMAAVFQNEALRDMAVASLRAGAGSNSIVQDKSGNPLPVQISVAQLPGSTVFAIRAVSANPGYTPVYLNALVNSFLDFKKTVRNDLSEKTLASIATQIGNIQQDIKSDQSALSQYEQSNNLVVLQQEDEVGSAYLAKLKTEMLDDQLQSNLLDAVALEKSTAPILGSTNLADPLFEQLNNNHSPASPISSGQNEYQQLEALKFKRARLSKHLRPDHPRIVELDQEITNAEDLISFYQQQNQLDIATDRQALQIQITKRQEAISNLEARLDFDTARISQSDNLKANIARNQSMFDRLTAMMNNVDITRNIDQDTLNVLQYASTLKVLRSYDKLKAGLTKAGFGGLALGLGIVLLIAMRDDRFSSMVEVTERLGDSVVGQVPEIPALRQGTAGSHLLLTANGDDHTYVESYRNLRSALLYLTVDGVRPKVLLITSAVPNEGKSTIASNLSCALALGGSRVLLVDGDLRKGCLHDLLGLQSKPGLTELLLAPAEPEKFIQTSPMSNLWFLARGNRSSNPGDLFLSNNFDGLLKALRERFDYIVIDSSPVFAADDATTLAPKVDGTLFVVRSRFSRSGVVKEALDLLYQRQTTVLGLILNGADASSRSYHYYKFSEYYGPDKTG